jgi:N-acetyl-gamma-glutamyl-phosphate reductase
MSHLIFVDGSEGTTGLKIHEFLARRKDITVLAINDEKRKNPIEKQKYLNEADVVFLCLPDDAARESVSLVSNPNTCIIDASTAHRTDPHWVYGLPELNPPQRNLIRQSKRIAIPGCHATGFAVMVHPLVAAGIVPKDYPLTCFSAMGYSGGGKKLIAAYENHTLPHISSHKPYALKLNHKHLPEMQKISELKYPPLFAPVIGNFLQGMSVSIPLYARLLSQRSSAEKIHEFFASYYAGEKFIQVMPFGDDRILDDGFLDAEGCNDTNRLDLFVFGGEEHMLLIARLDNLGKGTSGAAMQCMNLVLGLEEGLGLRA